MKHRHWLFRRNGIYYLQDAQTGSKESLHTIVRGQHEGGTMRLVTEVLALNDLPINHVERQLEFPGLHLPISP
jgi:hypothetical protein